MKLTNAQQETTNDLVNYIKFKGLTIDSPEALDAAFRDYLINGSASNWYLQKADDHEKKQFLKSIDKQVS